MLRDQNVLREGVRILKAMRFFSFKDISKNVLDMNYNSFINWLNQEDISLSREKTIKLQNILADYLDWYYTCG